MTIVFDGFSDRKFMSINQIYQFSRTMTLIHNFLNILVEEGSLDVLDYLLETLPIVKTSCYSIVIERTTIFFHPPLLGVLGNF